MNLQLMMLRLYLRNPAHRSTLGGDPIVILPNGKRIRVETIDQMIGDSEPGLGYTFYRLTREFDQHGYNSSPLGDCYDLEGVAKVLANESATADPRMPGRMTYHFGKR